MTAEIHPTAVVEAGACLHDGVVIGPFCHIGAGVEIGAGSQLRAHVVMAGRTRLGARAQVFPFAAIGTPSQDLKAGLAEGAVEIGVDCIIRESVTINAGAGAGTRIGARCALLAGSHVAHECRLGDGVVLANQVLLGGNVEIGDHASLGGGTAVHQNVRIGDHAFIGGLAGVEGDVIPFGLAGGNRAHLFGVNKVGLERRGFSEGRIAALREAFRRLFPRVAASPLHERLDEVAALFPENADVGRLIGFLRQRGARPLCAPRARAAS